jgi:hypothetical protein
MAKTETINQKSSRIGRQIGFEWGTLSLYEDFWDIIWSENIPSTFHELTILLNDRFKNSEEDCQKYISDLESVYGKLNESEYVAGFFCGAFDYYSQVWGWMDLAKSAAIAKG